ncbi:MAG: hypothetical protein ACK4S3_06130 [Parvibaculum sp.]
MGRPTDYTSELADAICERLADGESLRSICRDDGMPDERTVRGWAIENRDGFFPQYTRARDMGLDARADKLVEDAESAEDAALGRLSMDANRWYLSKMAPKRYGDKLELAGDPDRPLKVEAVEWRVRNAGD